MPPKVLVKLHSVISSLKKPFLSDIQVTDQSKITSAYRVGPKRVILKINLCPALGHYNVEQITMPQLVLSFDPLLADNENVSVLLASPHKYDVTPQMHRAEHRATLKVKPETKRLTLVFKESDNTILKSEQITIE